jgi:HlyD family secretion protein
MDRIVPVQRRLRFYRVAAAVAAIVLCVLVVWATIPVGVAVDGASITVDVVAQGSFRDDLLVRASVAPLATVLLDATEGGRVEEVFIRDGAIVKKGDLLFRLSNPQREQEMLARAADVAQQVSNLSSLRASLAVSRASARRELAELEFATGRQEKVHGRNIRLAEQGFISEVALEESADLLAQQRRLRSQSAVDSTNEIAIRERSIEQLESAIAGLNAGLRLMRVAVDGLAMRAPADGKVTGFNLQEGQSVKQVDRLGRIDTPDRFKLSANIDEFYLRRVVPGLNSTAVIQGETYSLSISRIDAQVRDSRFTVELNFNTRSPVGLQAGQSADVRITLGQPAPALLIMDGAFYADTGGAWVFVLDNAGERAARRPVRLGRRAGGQIEVLEGLKAGDRVIVSAYKQFDEAQQLRIEK